MLRAKFNNFLLTAIVGCSMHCHSQTQAIVGGTLIDLNNFGRSTGDISNAIILITDGKIVAVGPADSVTIPPGTHTIDARGMFLVPGLIDGFAALRTQAFANAYLYDGVTTIYVLTMQPDSGGDGELRILKNASPGPRLFLGAPMTGYSELGVDPSNKSMTEHRLHDKRLSNEQLIARIDRLADQGIRGVTISYDVWPDQVDVIIGEAKRRGLATVGELGFTSYPYSIRAGIDTLLRDDHYTAELAPALAKLTMADNLTAGRDVNRAVCAIDLAAPEVTAYGDQLAKSHTTLMPTLALEATADQLEVPNPWSARSASLIKPADLDNPADEATGASAYLAAHSPEDADRVRRCAMHKEALDARFYQLGARFLAGSAATSYGIMPGSGMHLELMLLHRIGLSPREALAAATTNYADVYGWQDVGRIAPGRVADILLLDADPRADTSALEHIHTLIFQGEVIDRNRLLN